MLHNLHPVPFTFNARKHGGCVEVRQNNLGYLDLVLVQYRKGNSAIEEKNLKVLWMDGMEENTVYLLCR